MFAKPMALMPMAATPMRPFGETPADASRRFGRAICLAPDLASDADATENPPVARADVVANFLRKVRRELRFEHAMPTYDVFGLLC